MKKFYLFTLLLISGLTFAQAPLLVEDFNYTASALLTANGWSAHSAGGTAPILVTSPGLSFAGYVGSGIGLAAGVNNTGEDDNKQFGAQTSGSVYASFMVNATATAGGYFFHFVDASASTAHRARTFITPDPNDVTKMIVGLSFNASTAQATMASSLNFGETYLFVAKYTVIEGTTNDSVRLYVFKAGDNFSTEPLIPTLGPIGVSGTVADISPAGIALRQFDATQRITVDGIRVKTFWQLDKDNPAGVNTINATENLEFYPNPVTNGYLNLTNSGNSTKSIEIFDVVGKKVLSQQTLLSKVDVTMLNPGIYVIKVSADNQILSSRFVVK